MADHPEDKEEKPWFGGGRAQGQSQSLKDGQHECGGASSGHGGKKGLEQLAGSSQMANEGL